MADPAVPALQSVSIDGIEEDSVSETADFFADLVASESFDSLFGSIKLDCDELDTLLAEGNPVSQDPTQDEAEVCLIERRIENSKICTELLGEKLSSIESLENDPWKAYWELISEKIDERLAKLTEIDEELTKGILKKPRIILAVPKDILTKEARQLRKLCAHQAAFEQITLASGAKMT